ncbi:MAG: hypothetical protein JHC41_01230 [Nitrosopumilus sp.]|nr:hypothetical protein [Nitrosopumilus sp.]
MKCYPSCLSYEHVGELIIHKINSITVFAVTTLMIIYLDVRKINAISGCGFVLVIGTILSLLDLNKRN